MTLWIKAHKAIAAIILLLLIVLLAWAFLRHRGPREAAGMLWNGLLDPRRAYDWQHYSGIYLGSVFGGIPSKSWSQCAAQGSIGVIGASGNYQSPQPILDAMNANSGKSCYVMLAAGNYYLSTAIPLKGIHDVELRAPGPSKTRLYFSAGATCAGGRGQCLISFESTDGTYGGGNPQFVNWTGNYNQGSMTIRVDNGAPIKVGLSLILDECDSGYTGSSSSGACSGTSRDNGGYFNCQERYNPQARTGCSANGSNNAARPNRGQQEMADVVSCDPACGTSGPITITLTHPLIHPNWVAGSAPQVWWINAPSNVGFQGFSIDGKSFGYSLTFALAFNNVRNFWVSKVALEHFPNVTLFIAQSENCMIQSNYLHDVGQRNNSYDASGFSSFAFNCRFENNIVQGGKTDFVPFGPYTGNVVAYNYAIDNTTNDDFQMAAAWEGHSNGADYDLYEGNVWNYLNSDHTHGSQNANTAFRNFFTGWESCASGQCGSATTKHSHIFALVQLAYSRYLNAAANVLGTPGISDVGYIYTNDNYLLFNGNGHGYPLNIGSGNQSISNPIPIDPLVMKSSMLWDNWDAYNKRTRWETSEVPTSISELPNAVPTVCGSGQACPASLYLTGKPEWWNPQIPWPANGPDVGNGFIGVCGGGRYINVPAFSVGQCLGSALNLVWNKMVGGNPAMFCYYTSGGTPDGSGGPIEFDPDSQNCYGGGSAPIPPGEPKLSWAWRAPAAVNGATVESYTLYQANGDCPQTIDLAHFTVIAVGVPTTNYTQTPAPAATRVCSVVTAVSSAGVEGPPSKAFPTPIDPEPPPLAKPGPPTDLTVTYSAS